MAGLGNLSGETGKVLVLHHLSLQSDEATFLSIWSFSLLLSSSPLLSSGIVRQSLGMLGWVPSSSCSGAHPDGVQHHPSLSWSENSEIRDKTGIKSVDVTGKRKKVQTSL